MHLQFDKYSAYYAVGLDESRQLGCSEHHEGEIMRYPIHRLERWTVAAALATVVGLAAIAAVVLMGPAPPAEATHSCSGVHIKPGNDLDAIVNRDPRDRATTFCVHASSSGSTYTVNNLVELWSGDKLIGQPGQVVTRGPASYGVPLVKIRNGASLSRLLELRGSNAQAKWLDIAGGKGKYDSRGEPIHGSGSGVGAFTANGTARMEYLSIHHNDATGIASMNGKLLHSNVYSNGTHPDFQGHTAAGIKGIDEFEVAYSFVHDNAANGIWCDHGCNNAGTAMPNGFWVHHNLVVNNGRWGVRMEFSPRVASGVHASQPTALIENNSIHGNGYLGAFGGASMWDAQNTTFRNNVFGPKTIAGVSYRANNNANYGAILFWDSGRADRTDLWNGDAVGNSLGGERIIGCSKPDSVVYCSNNG
jgi:hypothetical protein